jgi:hypothetical protein
MAITKKKKAAPSRTPDEQPAIRSFDMATITPTMVGQQAQIIIFGLGYDDLMYQWDGETRKWFYA